MNIPEKIIYGICVNDPAVKNCSDFTNDIYRHALERIALHGQYSHIEYSHVVHMNEQEMHQLRDDTLELGLIPWSVHAECLNSNTEERIKEFLSWQLTNVRNAAALGCENIVFHTPNTELTWTKVIEIIQEITNYCEDYGISAGMENVYSGPSTESDLGPVGYLIKIADEINSPNLGFTIDTGHANLCTDMTAQSAIRQFGSRIKTVHLQDNRGRNDDHLPPGLGEIDWREVMLALWEVNYEGPLLVEITGEAGKARRPDAGLISLPTEVEQALGANYLSFIHKVLKDKLPFAIFS